MNVYDSPENSSYKIKQSTEATTLENLLEFLRTIGDSEVFLAGDLNARTGQLNFTPEEDDWEDNTPQIVYGTQRSSRDNVTNLRGRKLLDFISSCNISLLNGCTLGDALKASLRAFDTTEAVSSITWLQVHG